MRVRPNMRAFRRPLGAGAPWRAMLAAGFSAAIAIVGAVPLAAPALAAPAFCTAPAGATVNTWTGGAGNGLWTSAPNWSLGRAPNNNDATTLYVCINANRTVTMRAGESAELIGIDVASGTTLTLNTGSMLYVHGPQTSTASYLRQGSKLNTSGTLGGAGRIELDGVMYWKSALTPTGASTISTRRCAVAGNCTTRTTVRGLLQVNDTGVVQINGGGVNLFDEYLIRVRGVVKLSNTAYVAADHGTGIELQPRVTTGSGQFTIANNGGWYEGRPWFGLGLSTFANSGLLQKTAGTATSVIDAVYSQTSGYRVKVVTGTLSLPPTWTAAANASAAAAAGFGTCLPGTGQSTCEPTTTSTETQNANITVPVGDASGANVSVKLDGSGPAGTIGQAVHATVGNLNATRADPAVMELRYDSSILGGKTAGTLTVQRQKSATGPFETVPWCDNVTGAPPIQPPPAVQWKACVDHRGLPQSSRMDGSDAIMVVRTTEFSRWVAL